MSETNLDKKIINLINIYNSSDYNSAILLANELIEKKINQSMVYLKKKVLIHKHHQQKENLYQMVIFLHL